MPDLAQPVLEKVTAFITRGAGAGRELLVFRHPSAGTQLPADTVEEGEDVEAALWREVQEETGLSGLTLLARLGEEAAVLPPDGRAPADGPDALGTRRAGARRGPDIAARRLGQ